MHGDTLKWRVKVTQDVDNNDWCIDTMYQKRGTNHWVRDEALKRYSAWTEMYVGLTWCVARTRHLEGFERTAVVDSALSAFGTLTNYHFNMVIEPVTADVTDIKYQHDPIGKPLSAFYTVPARRDPEPALDLLSIIPF